MSRGLPRGRAVGSVPARPLGPERCPSVPRANLSDSYFTNRQDRYVFLRDCPELADFFSELVDAVGDVSLQLQGDDSVEVVAGMEHPYEGGSRRPTRGCCEGPQTGSHPGQWEVPLLC